MLLTGNYKACRRRYLSSPALELPLLLEPLSLAASCFLVALSDLSILPTGSLHVSGPPASTIIAGCLILDLSVLQRRTNKS